MKIEKKVAIIGAGPAGLATALQLTRFNISSVVIEKESIGGLLKNAFKIENYLGFPEGISGVALIKLLEEQIQRNKIHIIFEKANELDYQDGKFFIKTKNRNISSKTAVIAAGTRPKKLKNTEIDNGLQDRIFYDVFPLQNLQGAQIGIIGAGDAAFDYAISLSEKNVVTIFNRGENEKCLPILKKVVDRNQNVRYLKNRNPLNITKDINKLKVEFSTFEENESHFFDYLIIAIGEESELELFNNKVSDKMDQLVINKKLFFVGDVKNKIYRQVSIATGDGIKAAMEINVSLKKTGI